ncbi:DUF305 domain-containing protein [Longimycelium tulufanense]|uniref:DUF305 domain-containing protein n=1 Tax=Longimycelium tulufanense TaxID=907463 RepID=A0A8J3C7E1_9PSEU|nr:DUF305 domain-containing protein [Longimycelium tulufanense]GGM34909.1 DUF305 domain-containing protein [Longimycelium tulufanense]
MTAEGGEHWDTHDETTPQRSGGVARVLVVTAGVLAVLLLGAAVGLVLGARDDIESVRPGAGSVDVGFSQDMSVHHLQAVQMAGWVRGRTEDPAIRQLAYDIETSQLEQVGRMKGWLSLWDRSELPTGPPMRWMIDDPGHGHGAGTPNAAASRMPGMATPEELGRLRSLSGKELDTYFLQLMLRHHQGGVPMMEYAAELAGQPVVRNIADRMLQTQSQEAETLKKLLAERGAQPLPAPN